MKLKEKRCQPCDGDVPPLSDAELTLFMAEVPGWALVQETPRKIRRTYQLADFKTAMGFVNAMADLAEDEGHHPNFTVSFSRVDVEIWTHAVGGLTENDFILAAKIDALPSAVPVGAAGR